MCGIAGAFDSTTEQPLPLDWLTAAAEAMRRRGPDALGFAQAPGFAAAHRRLSIIDLDGSPQPWVDADTGDVLVFNGEIYNYRELRRALAGEGARFRSAGDTEVLLRALQHWGHRSLHRLNGMFAFAWYRARDRRLWLVRDHAGIKPLYYALAGGRCVFASSMAAMLTLPGVERRLDVVAFSHYLSTIRATLGARTLVQGVATLEPGTLLELSPCAAGARPQRWWRLPAVPAGAKAVRDLRDVAAEVSERVATAVRRQLVSDVPLGGFLSGGLDSTIIASQAVAAGAGGYLCHAVGYRRRDASGVPYHEFPWAELAARHLGLDCRTIELEESAWLDDWRFLISEKGLPLSTPNEVAIYHLARALRERCTVALSGEGADEVFAGYVVPYASAWDFERAAAARAWPQAQRGALHRSLARLYGVTQFTSLTEHYFRLNSWIPLGLKSRLLAPRSIADAQHDEEMFLYYLRLLDEPAELTPMDRYLHLHVRVNLEGLLNRLDASTMAASVESRVPFTDPELMAFAFRLRDSDKLDFVDAAARAQGRTLNAQELDRAGLLVSKRALREAFRAVVPADILHRAKVSFRTPFQESLAGPWREFTRDTLLASPLIGELCDDATVRLLLEHPQDVGCNLALWPLLNLTLWAEAFHIRLPASGVEAAVSGGADASRDPHPTGAAAPDPHPAGAAAPDPDTALKPWLAAGVDGTRNDVAGPDEGGAIQAG